MIFIRTVETTAQPGEVNSGPEANSSEADEAGYPKAGESTDFDPLLAPGRWFSRMSLKLRLSLVTGIVVALSVALIAGALYCLVSASLMSFADSTLEKRAGALLEKTEDPRFIANIDEELDDFRSYTAGTLVQVNPAAGRSLGDDIAFNEVLFRKNAVRAGDGTETAIFTQDGSRVVVKREHNGASVLIARDMQRVDYLIYVIGPVLIVVVVLGILVAMVAGKVVARAGMYPIARLRHAADYVTRTNDLRPIEVVGEDELAQLTSAFNRMLQSLEQARIKQRQFVADAGHELKTPLTSMRTNIELLMMMEKDKSDTPISKQEREELEADVMSQMSELSNLIGDLVDPTREEVKECDAEDVELHETLENSLDRVRRRRPDVNFDLEIQPWIIEGDSLALGRATLNLIDNAAKWSPPQGTVRVSLTQVSRQQALLRIDDSGPGISLEEREKVFERFYRSAQSRSMPGSGIGLAIVKSVIERHHGSIAIHSSADGGARMDVLLPGVPAEEGLHSQSRSDSEGATGPPCSKGRRRAFVKRWFDRL